ncbi:uncharacterized protein PHACADRAFT_251870 [Phanerochaete carnosa HHB-10118-sp]|uniref:Transmembrane protein n=1 Tax=Phanerochaete carnosa (strain HHB-10118-sp) TaxID=650164 RepID=K5WFU2_PHACS|nr:uncharacterized protein PHACADRAFT_251870 [Phanerochaete carnosa HHB-10118-sp]EKM57949.1 hypothetical protein PHACADRAFT_251870 [Phanerochaete carnosa HHB-10118-sp]
MSVDADSSISPPFSLSRAYVSIMFRHRNLNSSWLPLASDTSNPHSPPLSTVSPNGEARNPATPQAMPNLAQTHVPVSSAAYAVPLSIAGAIVVFATIASAVQRRKLLEERAETQEEFERFQSMFHRGGGFLQKFIIRRFTLRRPRSGLHPPPMQRASSIPGSVVEDKDHESVNDGSDHYTRVYVPHFDRRPRPATKEPFYVATGRKIVTAQHSKTMLLPRVPCQPTLIPNMPRIYISQRRGTSVAGRNAAATGSVVDHYLLPSPCPAQPHKPTPVPMQHAHVRRHAPGASSILAAKYDRMGDLYEEVARRLE